MRIPRRKCRKDKLRAVVKSFSPAGRQPWSYTSKRLDSTIIIERRGHRSGSILDAFDEELSGESGPGSRVDGNASATNDSGLQLRAAIDPKKQVSVVVDSGHRE